MEQCPSYDTKIVVGFFLSSSIYTRTTVSVGLINHFFFQINLDGKIYQNINGIICAQKLVASWIDFKLVFLNILCLSFSLKQIDYTASSIVFCIFALLNDNFEVSFILADWKIPIWNRLPGFISLLFILSLPGWISLVGNACSFCSRFTESSQQLNI